MGNHALRRDRVRLSVGSARREPCAPVADAGKGSRTAMSNKTTTRADLLKAVYACSAHLSRIEAKDIVEMAIEEICTALAQGETVKLRGFGTFTVRAKAARVGRNPRTGRPYPIDARRVLTFKPSPRLIAALNPDSSPRGAPGRLPGNGQA